MRELKKTEMLNIEGGGSSISGTVLNAVYKLIDIIYKVGESLGSYIRRKSEDRMCDI